MFNDYKYYGNYNKNIKSTIGGGVITPSNPTNKIKSTYSINNTWDDEIIPTPPLNKYVYYSDKNLTNGYLNKNNYLETDDSISEYYYPSQKFNKVNNIKKNKKNNPKKIKLNNSNPINLPPPLINDKYIKNKSIKPIKQNKENDDNEDNDYNEDIEENKQNENNKYINHIINNSIYDGKYIYTLENEPIQFEKNKKCKITYLPYLYKYKSNDENIINNNEYFSNDDFSNDTNNDTNDYQISNNLLFIIFSILLIIYFTIYQKK